MRKEPARASRQEEDLLEKLDLLVPPGSYDSWSSSRFPPGAIYNAFREHACRLLPFSRVGVLLRDEDGMGFSPMYWWPDAAGKEWLVALAERHIDDGSFSLALRQNRPVVAAARDDEAGHEILHALGARSGVLGMFIGVLPGDSGELDALSLKLLSTIVMQGGSTLEILSLTRQIDRQNASLEEQIRQRTRELEQARDQAESANRAKSMFLSAMSHELRTPLTAVIGYAEQIALTLAPAAPEPAAIGQARTHADVIARSARHLLHIISDVLDVSKIESGKLQVEQIAFNVVEAVEEVRSTVELLAERAGLEFAVHYLTPMPRAIVSDPVRLRQILLNLCSNAIKFTPSGGIRVEVGFDPRGERLECCVIDTGIGIAAEDQGKLLQPFAQAESSTTRRFGGTGLGLFISARLAAVLGGTLEFSSEPGLGSRFRFAVSTGPVAAAQLCDAPLELLREGLGGAAHGAPLTRLAGRVLVADDWHDNQNLIGLYLQQAGLECTVVGNGEEAVEQALEGEYALILMDIQMPVMGGEEATALLRAAGFARPIVALTANVQHDETERYLGGGFDAVLAKPIDRREFHRTLARFLAPAVDAAGIDAPAISQRLSDISRRFREGLSGRIATMRQVAGLADWAALGRLAHDLKGAGGSFGHPRISELARQVEAAAQSGAGADAADLLEDLATEVERALACG